MSHKTYQNFGTSKITKFQLMSVWINLEVNQNNLRLLRIYQYLSKQNTIESRAKLHGFTPRISL